jgi:hypothetical protein
MDPGHGKPDAAAPIVTVYGRQDSGQIKMKLLASHNMPLPATFSYEYEGNKFDVAIRRCPESSGAELMVRGNLGNLPYTAEAPVARQHLKTAIDLRGDLPYANITLDSKQSIIVRGHMTFGAAPSPATVAAGTAAITMAIKPICDLIKNWKISSQKTWR